MHPSQTRSTHLGTTPATWLIREVAVPFSLMLLAWLATAVVILSVVQATKG